MNAEIEHEWAPRVNKAVAHHRLIVTEPSNP
jgi:hypothetical protein